MQQVEVTWPRMVSIAWLFFWRSAVGSTVIGFIIGAIVGFISVLLGNPPGAARPVIAVLAASASLIWSVYVLRSALLKKYKDFRIELVAR